MMPQFTKVHNSGNKKSTVFDSFYKIVDCEYDSTFKSYIVLLARSKVSILIDHWKQVPSSIKDSIWTDVKLSFDFIDGSKLKKKWITYDGTCWRGFKSRITLDYIMKPKPGLDHPWIRYSFISKKQWKKFVKDRQYEKFKAKSEIGIQNKEKTRSPIDCLMGLHET